MSENGHSPSRRNFFKGTIAGAAYLTLSERIALAQNVEPPCTVGFHYQNYTVQDQKVLTQASPGNFAMVAPEHQISIGYFFADSYANGASGVERRHLLCVDMAANPSITDIYVFSQADNSLLFWKKLSSGEATPSSMFVIPAPLRTLAPKITVVARSSIYGYWGRDFDLASAPANYTTAVNPVNFNLLCAGVPLARPYVAPAATGGQGDMGVLHRPNIVRVNDSTVRVFLGGQLNGSGKHPRFATNHYVMGGALFDQNGNLLSPSETVIYGAANDQQVTFNVPGLLQSGVKTLRAVMFDSLQGRFMSFLDI